MNLIAEDEEEEEGEGTFKELENAKNDSFECFCFQHMFGREKGKQLCNGCLRF